MKLQLVQIPYLQRNMGIATLIFVLSCVTTGSRKTSLKTVQASNSVISDHSSPL